MDGLKNGKPYFLMDDLGETHYFRKHPYIAGNWEPLEPYKKSCCHWQPQLLLLSSSLMFGLKYWILHRATLPSSKMPVFETSYTNS